jgi:hypothetical protein
MRRSVKSVRARAAAYVLVTGTLTLAVLYGSLTARSSERIAAVAPLLTMGRGHVRPVTMRFHGVLPAGHPAVRLLRLAAGDAVKLWVLPRPPKGQWSPLSFAIGLNRVQFARWRAYVAGNDCIPDRYANRVIKGFGQQPDFFSDYGGAYSSDTASKRAIDAIGLILSYTSWYYDGRGPCTGIQTTPIPYFWYGARSDEYPNGTWATFVAPAAGTYSIVLAGQGSYSAALSTDPLSNRIHRTTPSSFDQGSASLKVFPFQEADWLSVLRSHRSWFLQPGFFPHKFHWAGHAQEPLPILGRVLPR